MQVVEATSTLMDQLRLQNASQEYLIKLVSERPGHDRCYSIEATLIRSELGGGNPSTLLFSA